MEVKASLKRERNAKKDEKSIKGLKAAAGTMTDYRQNTKSLLEKRNRAR